MISNPVCFWVNGERRAFIYEGGSVLFHFSPHDNDLSTTLENNLVFLANNEKHALDVLKRMFLFVIQAQKSDQPVGPYADEFISCKEVTIGTFQSYLKALKNNKIRLTKAPTNQFYVVGWASNDIIH